jgi:hypothetical protein
MAAYTPGFAPGLSSFNAVRRNHTALAHYAQNHPARRVYTTFLPLLSAFSFAATAWFTKRNTERGRFSSLQPETGGE